MALQFDPASGSFGSSHVQAIPPDIPSAQFAINQDDHMFGDWMTGGMYSSAALQDAQNAYNRWLYEHYQSPAAMRRQYEEAGLNYNFAAQGANGSPQPASTATIQNKSLSSIVSVASMLNGFLGAMNEGTNLVRNIQAVPQDIAAKKWKSMLLGAQTELTKNKADSAFWKAVFDEMIYSGKPREAFTYYDPATGLSYNQQDSVAFGQQLLRNRAMDLMNQLRSYDLNNIKPLEVQKLSDQISLIANQVGISGKALSWFDANNVLRFIVPALMFFSKFF